MADRLMVIGGDAAGMSAAASARRRDSELEIVAFERGEYTSYSACGIPYFVGGLAFVAAHGPDRREWSGAGRGGSRAALATDMGEEPRIAAAGRVRPG